MTVALFVPCYVDLFYPHVARATWTLLERLGCRVEVPLSQTCCGQPLANAGFAEQARPVMAHFVQVFAAYDYIVAPSGSCVYHVRRHLEAADADAVRRVQTRTYELCQFLRDVLRVEKISAYFPYRVVVHDSCHGLRGLGLGCPSERMQASYSVVRDLLRQVEGLELVEPSRPDECCGFGGTFAIEEAAVSVRMGQDRLEDFLQAGAEVVTGTDMSCLMHLEGLARRQRLPLRFVHIAEILTGNVP
ncbi:(Fe-S)-binding protein [Rhodothermus profundi]|uniref:L-lactate dehydrogenase complex protein LldE n=1 Tax=Rhodothermus profundi TaxID=633813 RepID=A0A1M6X9I3_9BACT|nr:(Fe-S)-binding protein [Rhodothermus profundi]SHL02445.1 L-lactate dehydrogenase complex protein LldE [Rhodothermus profundi]